MGYILYYNIYINYLYLDGFNIKWFNLMSPLEKIDMNLINGNQFDSLENNGNPNKLKPSV